jgi:1-deoxy-D-xylulose 5-phosphate reductoisomerase
VEAFLGGRIAFPAIATTIDGAVERWGTDAEPDFPAIVAVDLEVREALRAEIG